MPAPETVTPIDLTGAPPLLARVAGALQLRLPADKLDRLAALVERIPPDATAPTNVPDEAYRWFVDQHVRRWLTAVGISFDGSFESASAASRQLWSATRRAAGIGWLTAFDKGADGIYRGCAGAFWPEMRPYYTQAAPGWDAAASAARVVADGSGRQTLEDVVSPQQDAALDLFEQIVWSTA